MDATPRRITYLLQWEGPRTQILAPPSRYSISFCPPFSGIPFLPGMSSLLPEFDWAGLLLLISFPQLLLLLSDSVLLSAQPSLSPCLSLSEARLFLMVLMVYLLYFLSPVPAHCPSAFIFPVWKLYLCRYLTDAWLFLVLHESDECTGFPCREADSELKEVLNKSISGERAAELYFLPLRFIAHRVPVS